MKNLSISSIITLALSGCDLDGLNQFGGQHISWPLPAFSIPAPVGRDRYELTYPYVTDPNYLRLTKSLATTRAWDFCKNNGFRRAEVEEPEPERITFECLKPVEKRTVDGHDDPNAPVVDEKKLFRTWGVQK
jgi:hypothetical protein